MDVSIHEFSDMVAPDEDCVLMERLNDKTVKVIFIGPLEECLERFEEGKHNIARKTDLQIQYDKEKQNKA